MSSIQSITLYSRSFYNRVKKSSLFKDAGIYTFYNIIDRSVPFLLLPVITRILEPEQYGIYGAFQALIIIVLPLISLNTDSSILRNYFSLDQEKFRSYFSNGILIYICCSILTIVFFYLFREFLGGLVNFPNNWLIFAVLICAFQYLIDLELNLLQITKNPKKYGIFKISNTLCKNILMLTMILYFSFKWEGLVIGHFATAFLFGVISIYLFFRKKLFVNNINKKYLADNIKFGAPLTLHRIGGWMQEQATRIILNMLLGASFTGNLIAGASFGLIIALLQDSFNKAFVPYLFEKLQNISENSKRKLVKLTYIYNSALLLMAIFVGIIAYFYSGFVLGANYKNAGLYTIWIAVGYAFDGMYKMHVNYIFYEKKTQYIFYITIISGIITVLLSFIFIKSYGAIGAGYAITIGFFCSYILAWIIAQRVYPMPWFPTFKSLKI
ncbi:oligosaccharide flippase family protein [soil metagenome]